MVGGPNPIRHTVVMDRYGNEIWNDGEFSFKINHVDDYGAIYGNSDHLFPDYSASKINYDMDFLWRSNQEVDPHELKETSRNTFFTLKNILILKTFFRITESSNNIRYITSRKKKRIILLLVNMVVI